MNNIELAYFVEAVICAYLLMYVMIKYGEQQRANKRDPDPQWLQSSRKTAFFVSALLIMSSAVAYQVWVISIPVVVLLLAIVMILTFNAISQHRRNPPTDRGGGGIEDVSWRSSQPAGSFGYYLAQEDIERLGVDISRLHRGQRLTHLQLEALFNHLKIDPGPAHIPADPVVVRPAQFRPRKAEEK
jgi:hypothetical protein